MNRREKQLKEVLKIKKLYNRYQKSKRRDVLKDYLILNGGLENIKNTFGSTKRFLWFLGPDGYSVFSRQYIEKWEKIIIELESIWENGNK